MPRIALPRITLCAASSIAIPETVRALEISRLGLDFGRIVLFTDQSPALEPGIEVVHIPTISSREDYSRFMLKDLASQIHTDFALVVQWDGYVARPENWRVEFLDHDYIGAIWPQFDDGHIVGNGGFSLRSRKLLMACTDPHIGSDGAEDVLICRTYRSFLESDHGIRFAPPDVAESFSSERTALSTSALGFHGIFNMPAVMGTRAFARLYRHLDHNNLHPREKKDLRKIALRRFSLPFLYTLVEVDIRQWLKRVLARCVTNGKASS